MAYECYHGNNWSLSWLDELKHGQRRGEVEFRWPYSAMGRFFLHICTAGSVHEVKWLLLSTTKTQKPACVCLCVLHAEVCGCVKVTHCSRYIHETHTWQLCTFIFTVLQLYFVVRYFCYCIFAFYRNWFKLKEFKERRCSTDYKVVYKENVVKMQ